MISRVQDTTILGMISGIRVWPRKVQNMFKEERLSLGSGYGFKGRLFFGRFKMQQKIICQNLFIINDL